jgi:hypothetical protein
MADLMKQICKDAAQKQKERQESTQQDQPLSRYSSGQKGTSDGTAITGSAARRARHHDPKKHPEKTSQE